MLSELEFITQSLELNLFFMRIAKEHAIFMEAAFVPKNNNLAEQADMLKDTFEKLLKRTIRMSEGVLSPQVMTSGEIITEMTYEAERETEYYTGIDINSNLTNKEISLLKNTSDGYSSSLAESVYYLNAEALQAARAIADFKSRLLQDVLSCKVYTFNYPLLIDHILREARFYIRALNRLQRRSEQDSLQDIVEQEVFWNRIMAEHSKFIRGVLDPTENELFTTANNFANEFDRLTIEAEQLSAQMGLLPQVTGRSLEATQRIRDFKRSGTEGLLDCKIRSIALPLLGDHVVREANHYLRILKSYKSIQE